MKEFNFVTNYLFEYFSSNIPLAILCGIIVSVILLSLAYFVIYITYSLICCATLKIRTKNIIETKVTAIVTKTEYEEEHKRFIFSVPESYNIHVNYKDIVETFYFDNDDIFYQYEKGDEIKLTLIKRLNKNNKVIKKNLEFY